MDGSDLEVPDFPALAEAFGVQNNGTDALVPMAKLSLLYDTTLNMPIDAQLDRKHASERELAACHLEHTQENDLLLYDRGYYAYWLVLRHVLLKRAFCFRLKSNANTQIKTFIQSGKKQAVITLESTQDTRQKARDRDMEITEIRVRLIRIKTTKGYYVLMTSLTDTQRYPAKDFYDLYHLRWRVEEGFKQQKAFLDVEDFSGRTMHSIKQDVHASVLSHALIAMECFASTPLIKAKVKHRKRSYKINFSQAVSLFKSRIVEILNGCLNTIEMYLWLKSTAENLTIIKPDRSFKREKVRCKRKKHRKGYKR